MKKYLLFIAIFSFIFYLAAEIEAEMYGGIDFPAGSISFADRVVSFTPGSDTTETNADLALGVPDWGGVQSNSYVSLGHRGELVLEFVDNSLTTSGDRTLDLWVFDSWRPYENTDVYVSKDGMNWLYVGQLSLFIFGVDLDAFVGKGLASGDLFSFVKLVDAGKDKDDTKSYAGLDIDAVGAISSGPPVKMRFTAEDLDAAFQDGYTAGLEAAGSGDCECATFSVFTNTLRIPCLYIGGSYWLDLLLTGGSPLTFEVTGFGEN